MNTYLVFSIERQKFAVSVTMVLEVLQKQLITHIPAAPAHLLGIINFRGEILPVYNTRQKFNYSVSTNENSGFIIVFDFIKNDEKFTVAAEVDTVSDVIEIADQQIIEVPDLGLSFESNFIKGALKQNNDIILLLNIEKVFTKTELANTNNLLETQTI